MNLTFSGFVPDVIIVSRKTVSLPNPAKTPKLEATMRTLEHHPLTIHPELSHPQHERGVFEVEGHCGGWREWLAYDSKGTIRIQVGLHDHDYDDGLEGRMEASLRRMEIADEEGQEA